jgi:hypothetical protein
VNTPQAKGAGALCQAKQEPKKAPIISFFISTVLGMDIFEVVTKLTEIYDKTTTTTVFQTFL